MAKVRFSIATYISLLLNFSQRQKFWAFGQGVEADFHFSKKNSGYAWLNYHTQGAFTNRFTATADSLNTQVEAIADSAKASIDSAAATVDSAAAATVDSVKAAH